MTESDDPDGPLGEFRAFLHRFVQPRPGETPEQFRRRMAAVTRSMLETLHRVSGSSIYATVLELTRAELSGPELALLNDALAPTWVPETDPGAALWRRGPESLS